MEKVKEVIIANRIPVVVENGGRVQVNRVISDEGGEGFVYHVTYKGHDYAMKWRNKVSGDVIGGPQHQNLCAICGIKNRPSEKFIWPLYMVREEKPGPEKRYGYLMELIPPNYREMHYFLMGDDEAKKARFTYFYNNRFAVCINIASLMQSLHMKGWTYKDLNPKNFAFDPATGDVLIIDNDNVSADNKCSVKGMIGYMAPEIPRSNFAKSPNILTDYYSLAVVLYRVLFVDHPMEGKLVAESPMAAAPSEELRLYGLQPVFHFDPYNNKNRPVGNYGRNANELWKYYPTDLRMLFVKAFTEGKDDPGKRSPENEWIRALSKAREKLILMAGGVEQFANFHNPNSVPPGTLGMFIGNGGKGANSLISVYPGKAIYRINVDGNVEGSVEKEAGIMWDSANKKLVIINFSKYTWKHWSPSTKQTTEVGPNGRAFLEANTQILFRDEHNGNYVGRVYTPQDIYNAMKK